MIIDNNTLILSWNELTLEKIKDLIDFLKNNEWIDLFELGDYIVQESKLDFVITDCPLKNNEKAQDLIIDVFNGFSLKPLIPVFFVNKHWLYFNIDDCFFLSVFTKDPCEIRGSLGRVIKKSDLDVVFSEPESHENA